MVFENDDQAQDGFHFRFEDYNEGAEEFQYAAYGTVKSSATYSGACSGSGNQSHTENPWDDSELDIAWNQKSYDASVVTSTLARYKFAITCAGQPETASVGYPDLKSYVAAKTFPKMTPGASTLSGSGKDQALYTTWAWNFVSDVPAD